MDIDSFGDGGGGRNSVWVILTLLVFDKIRKE